MRSHQKMASYAWWLRELRRFGTDEFLKCNPALKQEWEGMIFPQVQRPRYYPVSHAGYTISNEKVHVYNGRYFTELNFDFDQPFVDADGRRILSGEVYEKSGNLYVRSTAPILRPLVEINESDISFLVR